MSDALLALSGLSRRFGGLRALEDVDLEAREGEILGLIGPNGAGKSTLFNCLSGHLAVSAGRIRFAGRDVTRLAAARRARLGMARTFQLGKAFQSMTVRENVAAGLGIAAYGSFWRSLAGRASGGARDRRSNAILERFDLRSQAGARVRELPMGVQRRVEAARAFATGPRLLLLDEPAAGLTHGEAEAFAGMVRGVRDAGVTIIVIEHNMTFAMRLAERMYVLVDGRIIAEGPPEAVRADPAVVDAYLG